MVLLLLSRALFKPNGRRSRQGTVRMIMLTRLNGQAFVVNAEKIRVTGDKLHSKVYWRHSGYPGGIRSRTLGEMLARRPEEVIRKAVKGMLPRNRLARAQLRKLKVYAGPEHPHQAQQPQAMEIES